MRHHSAIFNITIVLAIIFFLCFFGPPLNLIKSLFIYPNESEPFSSFLIKERLKQSEQVYQRYVKKRRQFIKDAGGASKLNPWFENGPYYWDYFIPSFSCPHVVERIGKIGDGGKWVCGLNIFETQSLKTTSCVIYSFGVAKESSFEAECLERTKCEVHAFDFSVDSFGHQVQTKYLGKGANFNKIGLSYKDSNSTLLTLGSLMRSRDHDWIDILKIDIEGEEFLNLEQIMDEFSQTLPFTQLLIELHIDKYGRDFISMLKLWEKLEGLGLRAFMNEINLYSCVGTNTKPTAVEYSFLNIKGKHRIII